MDFASGFQEGRSDQAQATVYQKHRTVLRLNADVYSLTLAQ